MSLYKKLISTVCCGLLTTTIVNAQTSTTYPKGCEVTGFGFSNNFLILNETGKQSYYLMQNHSDKQIELEHYEKDPDAFLSPKLQSKIASYRWAAFASDVESTYFNCFVYENDERVTVNCSDVLDVCQYPRVKFALSNMGNYWVSTNKNKQQVIADSIKKGIFLHW